MRIPFATARLCDDALEEALRGLRLAMQLPPTDRIEPNPFASRLTFPVSDDMPSATIYRVF